VRYVVSKRIGEKDDEAYLDCPEKMKQEGLEKYLSVLYMKTRRVLTGPNIQYTSLQAFG